MKLFRMSADFKRNYFIPISLKLFSLWPKARSQSQKFHHKNFIIIFLSHHSAALKPIHKVNNPSVSGCFFPGDLNLNVVAMALSGYTDEKSSLWREMCSSLRLQLKNPYLCVMFAFLTSEPGAYDGVLVVNLFQSTNPRSSNAKHREVFKDSNSYSKH